MKSANAICKSGEVGRLFLKDFGRIVSAYYGKLIKDYSCRRGTVMLPNGVEIFPENLGDVRSIMHALKLGWMYDANTRLWVKGKVKFIRIYPSILEVLEYESYKPLMNIEGIDVVDVGAFCGDSSIYFALLGVGRVIAIEPNTYLFEELTENIRINRLKDRVIPLNIAITTTNKKRCNEMKLNEIIERYKIRTGLLKMNCEGCEYDIILNDYSAVNTFEELVFEYHEYAWGIKRTVLLEKLKLDYKCFESPGFCDSYPQYCTHMYPEVGIIHCIKKA